MLPLVAFLVPVSAFLVSHLATPSPVHAAEAAPQAQQVRIAWDFRSRQTLAGFTADGKEYHQRHYPRIKRLKSGDLLMTFMDGRYGWQTFQQKSKDGGRTWSAPRWIKKSFRDEVANDSVAYCNPDFLQLKEGTLLLVSQRRNNRRSNENEGIEVMRSSDEGETWSAPIWAFRGKNWEPSLLQLPSGEVQLLFTDTHDGSCHVGLVRSLDGGKTWKPAPDVQNPQAEYLSRTESRTPENQPFSMDGMAVGVALQKGKGIVYACECDPVRHTLVPPPVTPSIVWTSLAENWRDPAFKAPMTGPGAARRWPVRNGFTGYAPYLTQLDTGEVIVQANGRIDGVGGTWTFIGDDTARGFGCASRPFGNVGFWGCIAQVAPDRVLSGTTTGQKDNEQIRLTEGVLNRPLEVVGKDIRKSNSWFVGDLSQAQGRLSASTDATALKLRFLARDNQVVAGDPEVSDGFRLNWQSGGKLFRITTTAGGTAWLESRANAVGSEWTRSSVALVTQSERNAEGYQIGVSVPWELLGGYPRASVTAHLELLNVDDPAQPRIVDGVPGEEADAPQTWLAVHFPARP